MATIDKLRDPQDGIVRNGAAPSGLSMDVSASWVQVNPNQLVGKPASDMEVAEIAGARVVDEYPDTLRRLSE